MPLESNQNTELTTNSSNLAFNNVPKDQSLDNGNVKLVTAQDNFKTRSLNSVKVFISLLLLLGSLGGLLTYYIVNKQDKPNSDSEQPATNTSQSAPLTSSQSQDTTSATSTESNKLNSWFKDLNNYFKLPPTKFYTFSGFQPKQNLNANVAFTERPEIAVAELYLANYIADQILTTDWSGKRKEIWPAVKISEAFISDLAAMDKSRNSNLEIPSSEISLYSSTSAVSEIKSDIMSAHQEYVDFLKFRKVNQKYIDEFTKNTHPNNEDRFIYVNNTSINVPPTVNEKYANSPDDFSQRQITFYPVDIYNRTRALKDSGIIGSNAKLLRKFATKFLTYHELTHSLQRTVDSVNAPAAQKKLKSNYVYAKFSLRTIESNKQKSWGSDSENLIQNADINSESQADGIAFEIASAVFGLSESQQRLFWEFEFGRLAEASALYNRLFDKFPNEFPEFYMADFGTKILTDIINKLPISEDSRLLNRVSARLGGLGAYGGYLNPVTPIESVEIWKSLENI